VSPLVETKPRRIRLRREKGWRLADATNNLNGVVKVDRSTAWGNPFVVHQHSLRCGAGLIDCPLVGEVTAVDSASEAVRRLRHVLLFPTMSDPQYPSLDAIRYGLAGKDLACWCPDGEPCHADVLLALANGWDL
jgi:hypothetical protein